MKLTCRFFLVLIILSCSSKDDTLYKIDPRTFVENKITLANIADDIIYIPLDNSIPFINFKYVITSNSIYVAAKDIGILKFDKQGRLTKKIGRVGRGPGEFMYAINFTVDEKNGNVYVIDRPNITKVYSKNGTFLRNISLTDIGDGLGWGGDIECFNSLLFFPNSLGEGNSKYNWAFLDSLGNLVAKKENSVPLFQTKTGRAAGTYLFENKLFYYNYFNDTIFSVLPDLSYKHEYVFAQGEHRWPKAEIKGSTISQISAQIIKLFDPGVVFETKYYIVLQYTYLDKGAICFINKKTRKTYLAFKLDESPTQYIRIRKYTSYLLNDLDGGLPLKNLGYYCENGEEYLTTLTNPFNLKLYISSNEFKNSTPKYPEKKKELIKLANSLNETDNPILMLVRLKK
jgi:hypothetical protein